jgi:hypothetical protein
MIFKIKYETHQIFTKEEEVYVMGKLSRGQKCLTG